MIMYRLLALLQASHECKRIDNIQILCSAFQRTAHQSSYGFVKAGTLEVYYWQAVTAARRSRRQRRIYKMPRHALRADLLGV